MTTCEVIERLRENNKRISQARTDPYARQLSSLLNIRLIEDLERDVGVETSVGGTPVSHSNIIIMKEVK